MRRRRPVLRVLVGLLLIATGALALAGEGESAGQLRRGGVHARGVVVSDAKGFHSSSLLMAYATPQGTVTSAIVVTTAARTGETLGIVYDKSNPSSIALAAGSTASSLSVGSALSIAVIVVGALAVMFGVWGWLRR